MKLIPIGLIYSRLVMGMIALLMALFPFTENRYALVGLITAGLISDILDGIIARKLGISTERLRRLDSSIDQVFWVCIGICALIMNPGFFKDHVVYILLLLTAEACCYIISYARFRKEVATHAIASKIWTLTLFATLIELIWSGGSSWLFLTCYYMGMVTRLEIIMILLIIKQWTNDVPSVYHAVLLRNNKPIKRNKYFNG